MYVEVELPLEKHLATVLMFLIFPVMSRAPCKPPLAIAVRTEGFNLSLAGADVCVRAVDHVG